MRFGIFLAPFHRLGENPTLAIERDFKLVELLDELGYDEAWIGEHHSAGWETIASPEVFIAAAAQRTRQIKLGTGVVSLPYHHPLILADRMVQIDHMTRGRAMLGVGPGALYTDAMMLGIEPTEQRRMMAESVDAIVALLTLHALEASYQDAREHVNDIRTARKAAIDKAHEAYVARAGLKVQNRSPHRRCPPRCSTGAASVGYFTCPGG